MKKREIQSHSPKALRSLIGNFVIQNLRVPRTNKSGNIIKYHKDVNYKTGNRQIVHHKGDMRLRKLQFLHDLTDWFTVSQNRIVPNSRFITAIRNDEANQASHQPQQPSDDDNQTQVEPSNNDYQNPDNPDNITKNPFN